MFYYCSCLAKKYIPWSSHYSIDFKVFPKNKTSNFNSIHTFTSLYFCFPSQPAFQMIGGYEQPENADVFIWTGSSCHLETWLLTIPNSASFPFLRIYFSYSGKKDLWVNLNEIASRLREWASHEYPPSLASHLAPVPGTEGWKDADVALHPSQARSQIRREMKERRQIHNEVKVSGHFVFSSGNLRLQKGKDVVSPPLAHGTRCCAC